MTFTVGVCLFTRVCARDFAPATFVLTRARLKLPRQKFPDRQHLEKISFLLFKVTPPEISASEWTASDWLRKRFCIANITSEINCHYLRQEVM